MNQSLDTTPSLAVMLAYGIVILLYLVILRLLLDFLQRAGDKYRRSSAIDRGIRATMSHRHEGSMHAFDSYAIAMIIAKGGIAALSIAAIVVLLSVKIGMVATTFVLTSVILVAWAANTWLKSHEKNEILREVRSYGQKIGGAGTILAASIILVGLLVFLAAIK